jgi:hypothetical protein
MSVADRVSLASKALGTAIDGLNSFGQFTNDTVGASLPHPNFLPGHSEPPRGSVRDNGVPVRANGRL